MSSEQNNGATLTRMPSGVVFNCQYFHKRINEGGIGSFRMLKEVVAYLLLLVRVSHNNQHVRVLFGNGQKRRTFCSLPKLLTTMNDPLAYRNIPVSK